MKANDSELMSAFRDGDRHAFDELVDRYADHIYIRSHADFQMMNMSLKTPRKIRS
jgi:hypothetical protein